jgi:hypothetical protein
VLRDEDVDELVVQPDGAMENTNKRRCVMQSRVVLVEVVLEEGEGGRSEEEWLLNRCRGRSRAFPQRSSSTASSWDWRDVFGLLPEGSFPRRQLTASRSLADA